MTRVVLHRRLENKPVTGDSGGRQRIGLSDAELVDVGGGTGGGGGGGGGGRTWRIPW